MREGCAWEAIWGAKYCATHLEEAGEETVREWRSYLQQNAQKMEKASLTGAPLDGINLKGANLRAANLFGAKLNRADLESANLQGARLTGASLKGTMLARADLSDAKMRGTDLDKADLSRAVLKGAELYAAKLRAARMVGADLSDCDLREAKLEGADMRKARLEHAMLGEAKMQHVDLTGAILDGCDLSKANLRDADLTAISFTRYVRLPKSVQATLLRFALAWGGGSGSKFGALLMFAILPVFLAAIPFVIMKMLGAAGIPIWAYVAVPIWPMLVLAGYAALYPTPRKPEDMKALAVKHMVDKASSVAEKTKGGGEPNGLQGEKREGFGKRWAKRILYPTVWNGAVVDALGPCDPLELRYIKDQSFLEASLTHSLGNRWKKFWMFIWGLSCGYGDNIWLWVFWSILCAASFGTTYVMAGPVLIGSASAWTSNTITPLYFSLVTLATVGYGDVTPSTAIGQVVVSMEIVLGYLMLGGLISLLANKLARMA